MKILTQNILKFLFKSVLGLGIIAFQACNSYQVADDKIYDIPLIDNLQDEKTRQFLQDVSEDYPNESEVFYKKALFHLKKNEDSLALKSIQRAISLDNTFAKYYYVLAKAFQKLRQIDKALVASQTAIKENSKLIDIHILIAELYLAKKRYDKALEYLNNAEKITKFDERIYYLRGSLALEKLDSAQALSNFRQALNYKNDYVEVYASLAKLYNLYENPKLALEFANKGLKFAVKNDALNYQKAEAFRAMRFYEDSAKVYYMKAYQANPELYGASYQVGLYYFKAGQIQEANKYFLASLQYNPNFAAANYYAGISFSYLGKLDKALKYLEKTIKLDPLNYAARDLYWGVKNQIALAEMRKQADSLQRAYYEQQEKLLKQLQQQMDSTKKQTP
ncbi:MAG: tetratricopeptide repeat protein [Microscillaceae bacterium]|nr:tetratricopeptide repeat protein [Microscillaceae bacterium]MDW8460423.1 tetratricopeptide repeat protein [Cytophagales bacterium]